MSHVLVNGRPVRRPGNTWWQLGVLQGPGWAHGGGAAVRGSRRVENVSWRGRRASGVDTSARRGWNANRCCLSRPPLPLDGNSVSSLPMSKIRVRTHEGIVCHFDVCVYLGTRFYDIITSEFREKLFKILFFLGIVCAMLFTKVR